MRTAHSFARAKPYFFILKQRLYCRTPAHDSTTFSQQSSCTRKQLLAPPDQRPPPSPEQNTRKMNEVVAHKTRLARLMAAARVPASGQVKTSAFSPVRCDGDEPTCTPSHNASCTNTWSRETAHSPREAPQASTARSKPSARPERLFCSRTVVPCSQPGSVSAIVTHTRNPARRVSRRRTGGLALQFVETCWSAFFHSCLAAGRLRSLPVGRPVLRTHNTWTAAG